MDGVGSRNPEVMNGALVFKGTRVPVEIQIHLLAAGDSLEDFLEGFPSVSRELAVAYLEKTPEAVDRGIPHQQNLQGMDLAIVLLEAPSNRLADLTPLVEEVKAALQETRPGEVGRVQGS